VKFVASDGGEKRINIREAMAKKIEGGTTIDLSKIAFR
jgi:hypothetical protein